MNQITRTILRNSAFGMVAQMLIKVLSFAFSVLIIRNLGAVEFGQYSAVIAFGISFTFFSDLGLSPYMVREIAYLRDKPDSKHKIRNLYANVLRLRLILSGFTGVMIISAAWLTGRSLLMIGAVALNAIGLVIYSIQGASDAVLAGYERLDISSSGKVIYQLVFVMLGGSALLVGLGYYGLIGATMTAVIVLTVFCWLNVQSLGVLPGKIDRNLWRELIRVSLPFGIIGLALGLSYKFDSILLNIYRGDAETGYYNAAYNLVFSAVLFSNVINTSLFPSLSRQSVNDPDHLSQSYERSLRYLMVAAFPIAVGVWALAAQIIPFLFTSNYIFSIPVLQMIIWVVPLMYVSELFGYIVLISGKEKKAARAVLVSTGINVLANMILVPRFGLLAAAIMTVLTEAVLVGQYIWVIRKLLMEINLWRSIALPGMAAVGMGFATLALRESTPLFVNVVMSALLYFCLLLLFKVIGKQEMDLLRNIRSFTAKAPAK